MTLLFSQVFNQSLEVGSFLNNTTDNVTGSPFLSLLIVIVALLLIAILFHMPETLWILPIIPVLIVFSTVDLGMQAILAVVALIFAYILFQLIPIR